MVTLTVEDRNYSKFYLTKDKVNITVPKKFDPLLNKLLDMDEISILKNGSVSLIHSPVRQHKCIPGVLVLKNKKTYGRVGKKMLYQCQPDDKHLPTFLVPYQEKIGFTKNPVNKYVTFEFLEWNDKHPRGKLTNSLGSVDELSNFYEYQLYCKSLNASIQNFTRDAASALKAKTEKEFIHMILEKYPEIHNKIEQKKPIFSIDPKQSRDYDDAVDIEEIGDNEYKICIYIANVPLWMEVLNLWESFSNRVSTIYLPDRRRPMLPTCLSECLCSLVEKQVRFAFTCELHIKDNEVIGKEYYNSAITVYKNFGYDDTDLEDFIPYKLLYKCVMKLRNKFKAVNYIKSSHDVVCYLMILMNNLTGNEMIKYTNGIYRSVTASSTPNIPEVVSKEAQSFLQIWHSNGGEYVKYSDDVHHDLINLSNYIHITSPIRRLVDLLNMIEIQINMNFISMSSSGLNFLKKWIEKLDYINKTTRAIRKVQSDCNLLQICTEDKSLYEKVHKGVIFDKIKRNDGYFQYGVYLYDIKLVSRIRTLEEFSNYSEENFKIYLFNDEANFKKKIKLSLV
jgi:exoribonuclease R